MLTAGSLFSGYGGLSLAVEQAMGATTRWVSDVEPAANRVLARRFPTARNLGDITTINWATVEPVDIIEGGSPCQDVSAAGRRAGMTEGTRSNLWVAMREAIHAIKPAYVIWENVAGALSATAHSNLEPCKGCMGVPKHRGPALRALGRVLGDLSGLGFDAEWITVPASDVGCCHRRRRVFVLAWHPERVGMEGHGPEGFEVTAPQAWARLFGCADHRSDRVYSRSARLTTAVTDSPRLTATAFAADHSSSGTRIARSGVSAIDECDEFGSGCVCPGDGGERGTAAGAVELENQPVTVAERVGGLPGGLVDPQVGTLDESNGAEIFGERILDGLEVVKEGAVLDGCGGPVCAHGPTVYTVSGEVNPPTDGLSLLPTPTADNSRGLPSKGTDFQSLPNVVCDLLPTPTATPYGTQKGLNPGAQYRPSLDTLTRDLLPTPRATDGTKGGPNQRGSKGDLTVPSVVAQSGTDWGKYGPAIDRHAHMLGRAHPAPTTTGARGNPKLSAHFTEWMMCAPAGWIGDLVDDGTITNNAGLKLSGNGVVIPQAVHAIRTMLARAFPLEDAA